MKILKKSTSIHGGYQTFTLHFLPADSCSAGVSPN